MLSIFRHLNGTRSFLCAAQEFDPGIAILCAEAQGSPTRTYPTFSLSLALFDEPRWDSISAHRPLRRARLPSESASLEWDAITLSALRADERVVNFLKGLRIFSTTASAPWSNRYRLTTIPPCRSRNARWPTRLFSG